MTAAGVGCALDTEVVAGATCACSGPRTTTGEVVLGRMGCLGEARSVAEMPTSARFTSSLGGSSEGCTSAAVGMAGLGGTMVLTTVFSGDQITAVGIGTSLASVGGDLILGCTSVWAPGAPCATSRNCACGAACLPPVAGVRAARCGPGYL